ncbi:MAG TPA: MBL fold metallo-hydrolase [Nitriliruptorales bacterium]
MSSDALGEAVGEALAELDAPVDPRASWALPAFGTLPAVTELDEVVTRVLAPNPSLMTLDGTNTYVLGQPGTGTAIVVDPGPDDDGHLARVEQVLADRDLGCELVLVTHHHHDHSEAAQRWARRFGCRVAASTPEVAGDGGWLVSEADRVELVPGLRVEVVATPGHTRDHLAFRLGHGPVLTGDHILGRGTSVVAHPDGDLVAYLDSLGKVLALGPDALYPGHGPELADGDPTEVVAFYLAHRRYRERQLLTVLSFGPRTPRQLVEVVYAGYDPSLWDAAERSTRAAIQKLVAQGQVRVADGAVHRA